MDELIIAVISLVLSFFFSGTETAFVSVSKLRVEVWHKQKVKGAGIIKSFISHPEKFLYTTLVGTNIANIACATYGTLFFMRKLDWSPQLTWLTMTASILIFGEIIPKYFFRSFADYFVKRTAIPLKIFYYLLYPVILFTGSMSIGILKLFGLKKEKVDNFFSRSDLEILLHEHSSIRGEDDTTHREMVKNVLEFKNVKVKDAMIPRTDIIALDSKKSISTLRKLFITSGRTRIPIYKDKLDNIIGMAIVKDMFKNPTSIIDILHNILFVPEYKNVDDLLREFQQTNQSIAIVVDEYGGTEGLITNEDLVEVIIGEIQDEYDEDKNFIKELDKNEWRVHARTEIDQFNQELKADLPKGEYDTIGGYLLDKLGHIPKQDEMVEEGSWRFTITRATLRNIQWIRVVKLDT